MNSILSLKAKQVAADGAKASNRRWWSCAGGHGLSEASLFGCA